jgi:hypothetical protein
MVSQVFQEKRFPGPGSTCYEAMLACALDQAKKIPLLMT